MFVYDIVGLKISLFIVYCCYALIMAESTTAGNKRAVDQGKLLYIH